MHMEAVEYAWSPLGGAHVQLVSFKYSGHVDQIESSSQSLTYTLWWWHLRHLVSTSTADWTGTPTLMLYTRKRWAEFYFWGSSDLSIYATRYWRLPVCGDECHLLHQGLLEEKRLCQRYQQDEWTYSWGWCLSPWGTEGHWTKCSPPWTIHPSPLSLYDVTHH